MRFRDVLTMAVQQGGGAATPPPATITFVNHAAASYTGASTGATTGAIDTSAADFIVLSITGYAAGDPFAVSDSKGNTWTALTEFSTTGPVAGVQNFYCTNPTKGSGHTFTLSGNNVYGRINASTFSGVKQTSPFDAEISGTGLATSTTNSGAIVPAQSGELFISLESSVGGSDMAFMSTPAFISLDNHNANSGQDFQTALAYYVQAVGASIDSSWGGVGTGAAVVSLTAFKPA